MSIPRKNLSKTNSVKWKNVFSFLLFFFIVGLVWNAINYQKHNDMSSEYESMKDTLAITKEHIKEAQALSASYQERNEKLVDSCKNLTISYLNDTFEKYVDSTSTYWYVTWETKKLTGYDVIKLSRSSFSLIEAQSLIEKSNDIKEPFLNIMFFEQVSEKCWAEFNKK